MVKLQHGISPLWACSFGFSKAAYATTSAMQIPQVPEILAGPWASRAAAGRAINAGIANWNWHASLAEADLK